MSRLNEEQLCLNLRQSSDGKFYRLVGQCLPMKNHRVPWRIEKEFSYLKLSICSKKYRTICGTEIEMKEGKFSFEHCLLWKRKYLEMNTGYFTPMIIGIIALTNILILFIVSLVIFIYCRLRNKRIKSNMNKLDKSARP